MFSKGDKILHPMHGAGTIKEIVDRKLDGEAVSYYEIELVNSSMVISFPVRSCAEVGVRAVLTKDEMVSLIREGEDCVFEEENSWNKRYRDNMLKIRSGDFLQVYTVVKCLESRKKVHNLSNGEKKMFDSARHILISEISSSLDVNYEKATEILAEMLDGIVFN